MKNSKRILEVVVETMSDSDPDTSHLGEYSERKKSDEYSIDRKHDLACNINSPEARAAENQLQGVIDALSTEYNLALINGGDDDNPRYDSVSEAIDLVQESIDELQKCSCGGHGIDSRELRYFNPNYENYKGLNETEIRKYCIQDFERMESLNSGQWYYIGIRAKATIQLTGDLTQTITSGGLWGIESDSGKDFITETEDAELHDLRQQLKAIGFSTRAISKAFKDVKHKD